MDDTLDILNGISVAVAVSESAVDKRSSSRPDESDEALISVPYIYHVVELIVRCADLEVIELAVPVVNKLLELCVDLACLLILSHDSLSCLGILLSYDVDDLCCLSGSKLCIRLESAAGIGVVVHSSVALAVLNSYGVAVGPVRSDKAIEVSVCRNNVSAHKTEESLSVVAAFSVLAAVLVDMLNYLVALKACSCDKKCILEVYLILLIVVLVCELTEAEQRQISLLVGVVCYLNSPYLIGLVERNIVSDLGLDAGILAGNSGISGTVTALGLILIEGLAYRLPCGAPEILSFIISYVYISSRKTDIGVETIAEYSSVSAALYKAVSSSVIGNDSAVLR